MAVIISNTLLYTPLSSSSLRKTTFHNHNSFRYTKLFTCKAVNESSEEARWLREEQRWLREEQRWLREEARWNAERNSLLLQIQHLQSKLDRNFAVDLVVDDNNDSKTLIKLAALLKGLENDSNSSDDGVSDDSNRISEFSDDKTVTSLEEDAPLKPEVDFDEVDDTEIRSERRSIVKDKIKEKTKAKAVSSLRMGAEGDEVRILQEALMTLGFYSGEEDMEYSSFSDGTARAVKTWQASIGIREDGIMTAELLDRLYASQEVQSSESSLEADVKKIDEANGAIAEVREVQQTIVKKGPTDAYVSEHRVFLLGENRWEEPSRLNKTKGNTQVSAGRCLTCKGEGRLLCMECDGTGEPNVEEQFLDWVEEEAKCPYCEGLGYNVCDVCEGKPGI